MQLTWNPWATVSQGRATAGSKVTVLPYANRLALFIADPNGGVYTAAGAPDAGWGPWSNVSQGSTTPGAPVSAAPYENRFALFLVDPNGGVYTVAGTPDAGWGPWSSVSQGSATPGAPVTVLPYGKKIAVFIADPNGGIYTTAGTPDAGWGPWTSVSEGRTVPGSLVTAVPRAGTPLRFELFITDPNGGIYTVSGNPDTGWGPWSAVPNIVSAPGSPIGAVQLGSQVALFVTDSSGKVAWTIGSPETNWRPWVRLSEGAAPPHSLVSAAPAPWLGTSSTYAILLADPNGGIYASVGEIYEAQLGWGPWASVSDGRAAPGSPVTVITSGNRLAVFIADPNGGIYATSSRFAAPQRPTELRETSVSANAIGVAWVDNTNDADGFRISYVGTRTGQANHEGQVSVGSTVRAATLGNLLSGYTYTIRVVAFNAAGTSGSSNAISVTTPNAQQTVPIYLLRQQVVSDGPIPIPYLGQYPPAIGTVPAGRLLQIALPHNLQVLGVNFVRPGHSTEECGNPDAVVTVTQETGTTAAQLAAIFGMATPRYSSSSPIQFLACLDTTPDAPVFDSVIIQLTIISDES